MHTHTNIFFIADCAPNLVIRLEQLTVFPALQQEKHYEGPHLKTSFCHEHNAFDLLLSSH